MWCVASAPIVPLARDLDAALGMPRGELPFISASFPRHSPQPHSPLGLHPRFFHKVRCRFLAPASLSRAAPAFFHKVPTPLLLSADLSPRLPAPAPRPAPQHASPSAWAPPQWDLSSENTKKRAPFLGERCSFWVAKRSTFGRVVLTCATMGGHTGGKLVRRRGLACATCAVDLIDAPLYFSVAGTELVFAHLAVAIDAAHHFAGGLFHTARGRLCGRGGRGRRRGGRARR